MFELKFSTGNAAFHSYDENDPADKYYEVDEVIRILRSVIEKLQNGYDEGSCIDYNGNKVGEWELR